MSTNPDLEPLRADDEIVTLLSEWLAFHMSNDELRSRLAEIDSADLSTDQAEAVDELTAELDAVGAVRRGELEMLVRETLEAVALG